MLNSRSQVREEGKKVLVVVLYDVLNEFREAVNTHTWSS